MKTELKKPELHGLNNHISTRRPVFGKLYQNGRGEMMALTKILIYYIDWSM